jgi:hypothetical protein
MNTSDINYSLTKTETFKLKRLLLDPILVSNLAHFRNTPFLEY